jgi:hypothetical protein
MSSSTRFGFAQGGVGSGGSDLPPGARPPRDTQTIYGRELHLRPRAFPGEPPAVAAVGRLPPAPVRASARVAFVRQPPPRPSHTGKSGFPANAGVWGRRNAEGELEPLTDPGLGGFAVRSRFAQPFIQHVLVVMSAAFISFIAVLGVMKARQPVVVPAPARAAEAAAAEPATIASAPSPAPLPEPTTVSAPAAASLPAAAPATRTDAVSAAGPRPTRGPLRKPRSRHNPDFSRDPDSTLPPSF